MVAPVLGIRPADGDEVLLSLFGGCTISANDASYVRVDGPLSLWSVLRCHLRPEYMPGEDDYPLPSLRNKFDWERL